MKNILSDGFSPLPTKKNRAAVKAPQAGITPPQALRSSVAGEVPKDPDRGILTIEWKHLDRGGRTCDRCGDTGRSLREAVRVLRRQCGPSGVAVELVETTLPAKRLRESNAILINGIPLERALGDATSRATDCRSCSALVGEASQCRAVRRNARTYEAIPETLIREAACRVAACPCPA